MWPLPSPVTRRSIQPSSVSRQGEKWTLLGDHHLLDHPSHRPEGGDGFTAETAETAEQHAQETTKSASGSSPPDPPDPPSWLCREGGDGFTAETAETAEQHAQETTKSASGSSPPDPPDPPSWLWPHLRGLCDLCGEPRVSISTVSGGKMVSVRFLPGKVHGHQ